MSLTTAQLATLKTSIQNTPSLATSVTLMDWAAIANFYNALASPSFTVWRSNVGIDETGQAFNGTELSGLTSTNNTRLQTLAMYLSNGYNAGLADARQFFNDIFSGAGGTNTRANLLVIWKRFATAGEKLFATGTGSDASPAVLVFEGAIDPSDVQKAMGF